MVKLQGKPFTMTLIQTYAPARNRDDDAVEILSEQIQKEIYCTKSAEMVPLMESGTWMF